MKTISAMRLNGTTVELSYTPMDWDSRDEPYWSIVYPDPSGLRQRDCIGILTERNEVDTVREIILHNGNIVSWHEAVLRSDEQHWDEFRPVLNYHSDIPDIEQGLTPAVMQYRLRDLPIVVVKVGETYKLAACTEYPNMDLEFCRAYMRLGFLPPFTMINVTLPHCAIEPELMIACKRTIELVEMQCATRRSLLNRPRVVVSMG